MIIRIKIPDAAGLASKLGITAQGQAQIFHTQNIFRHMLKYMPMETGMFATKQTQVSSATQITTRAPQAYYLYYGKRMVNSKTFKGPMYIPGVGYRWPRGATLVPTDTPLNYTTTFHPLAGPFWDERMMAAEGNVIAQELKDYIGMQI